MSVEENKALAASFLEDLHNKKDLDVIGKIMAPNWTAHLGPDKDQKRDQNEFRESQADIFKDYPDLHDEIHDLVAEGDRVAVFHTRTATSPEGKKIKTWMFHLFRIADGKIAEEWLL